MNTWFQKVFKDRIVVGKSLIAVWWIVFESFCFCCPAGAAPTDSVSRQQTIEATFTILIADYVTWNAPDLRDKSVLKVLVVEDDAYAETLNRVLRLQRSESDRKVVVKTRENADDLESAHILYVGDVSDESFEKLLDFSREQGMLLVSDREDFIEQGGLIQFVQHDNRLKFIINKDNLEPHRIKISSKLLKLSQLRVNNG